MPQDLGGREVLWSSRGGSRVPEHWPSPGLRQGCEVPRQRGGGTCRGGLGRGPAAQQGGALSCAPRGPAPSCNPPPKHAACGGPAGHGDTGTRAGTADTRQAR